MFSLATYKCILCKRFLFYTHGFRWKTHNPDDSLLLGIQKMTSMSMSYWNMTEKNNFCYFKYWQIPARPDELRLNCGFSSMAIQYGVKTNGLYPLAACIFLWLWPKQTFLWNIINIFTIIIYCVVLKILKYRVFIKYCVFFWTLPVLLQRWVSTCLLCVHTLTLRENRERPESRIF